MGSRRIAGHEPLHDGLMTDHICAHIQNLSCISSAFNAEVDDAPGQLTDLFEPAPLHWRLLFTLPPHLKRLWRHNFRKELEVLIKNIGIFTMEEPESEKDRDRECHFCTPMAY